VYEHKSFWFVGVECYDIIYYTAKVASNLGFKCIMVDLAKDGALSYLYQDTFSAGEVVNVNGIDLIKGPLERSSSRIYL